MKLNSMQKYNLKWAKDKLRSDKKNITNTDEEKIKKLINVNKNKVKNFEFYEKNFINKEMNNYNFSKIEKYIKI